MSRHRYRSSRLALLLALATVASLAACRPTPKSTVRVKNVSASAITDGELQVCRQHFPLARIEPGGTASFTFKASFDSAYSVRATLASGHTVTGDVGYVTSGMVFDDELLIRSDRVDLGAHDVKLAR